MNTRRLCLAAVALAIALGVPVLPALADKPDGKPGGEGGGKGPSYQIIQLQGTGGLFDYAAIDINNPGLIVGHVYVHDPDLSQSLAACWTVDHTGREVTSTLHFLADGDCANGVNDLGEIVGWRSMGQDESVALYWESRDAQPLVLPALEGDVRCRAEAINNDGVICGISFSPPDSEGHVDLSAVAWRINVVDVNGQPIPPAVWGPVELPKFNVDNRTVAVAVKDNQNDTAPVVGYGVAALVWNVVSESDGSLSVELPEVLNPDANAEGVNSSGVICGQIYPDPVVWDGNSTQVLDTSATIRFGTEQRSITSASAFAINADGTIVGRANAGLPERAVVWPSPNSPIILLNKFIRGSAFGNLQAALDVNDSGQIVGYGWDGDLEVSAAFLAIPK